MKNLLIMIMFLSSACQTTIESSEKYEKRTSYIVYSASLAEGVGACDLSIAKAGKSLMRELIISKTDEAHLAEIDPGTYTIETMTCGGKYVDLKGVHKKFKVRKNRLNYIGNLDFSLDEKGQPKLSFNSSNLDKVLSLSQLSETRKKLKFAYNGKRVGKKMISESNGKTKIKMKLKYNGQKPELSISFKECRENSKSPFIVGHADFEVEYQGYHPTKVKLVGNYSSMNRKDVKCFKEALKKMQPKLNGSFAAFVSIN